MAAGQGGGPVRLHERRLVQAQLRPRIREAGGLGGLKEAFSETGVLFRASLLPGGGGFETEERGALRRGRLRLLAPADLIVQAGDGVLAGDRLYRVVSVQAWAAHTELDCEALT